MNEVDMILNDINGYAYKNSYENFRIYDHNGFSFLEPKHCSKMTLNNVLKPILEDHIKQARNILDKESCKYLIYCWYNTNDYHIIVEEKIMDIHICLVRVNNRNLLQYNNLLNNKRFYHLEK